MLKSNPKSFTTEYKKKTRLWRYFEILGKVDCWSWKIVMVKVALKIAK